MLLVPVREELLSEERSDWLLREDGNEGEEPREDCSEGLLSDEWSEAELREVGKEEGLPSEDWMFGLLSDDCSEGLLNVQGGDAKRPVELKALLVLIPRWVRVLARFPVLLPPLRDGYPDSSGSNGVGRGGGNCRLERSGKEPPVFSCEGTWGRPDCWSGEGKIVMPGTSQDLGREEGMGNFLLSQGFSNFSSSTMFSSIGGTGYGNILHPSASAKPERLP